MFMFSAEMMQTGYAFLPITNNPASIDILYAVLVDSGHDAGRRWIGKWDSSTWVEGVDEFLITTQLTVIGDMGLFVSGEQGFWYDPSDFSTMFQDSAGLTPVTSVGQPVGRILDKSGNGNHATQATTSKKPILKRMPTSGIRNVILDSGDVFAVAAWGVSGSWNQISVNPYYAGDSAYKITNDGVLSSRNFTKSIGVSNGSTMCLSVIFEKSVSETALKSVIAIRDNTASAFVARADLNWAGGSVIVPSGTGYCEKLSDVGPSGGVVYRLVCAGAVPAGNAAARFIYPTSTNTNTESIIIHSCQLEVGNVATAYQKTVGGYDVSEGGFDQVYWLDFDGVDDALVSSNPDLGTNVTRARATINGAVIEQGLTLAENLQLSTDNLGLIIINRPLTQSELSDLTAYLNGIAGK
jgi:hypothetical protein